MDYCVICNKVEVDEENLFCTECYERYVKYGFMDPRDWGGVMKFYAIMLSKEFNVENFSKCCDYDETKLLIFNGNNTVMIRNKMFESIYSLGEAIEIVNYHFETLSNQIQNEISSMSSTDKILLEQERIERLKFRCVKVAQNIINADDDKKFYNNLDEMFQLKKQIFQGRNDEIDSIRRQIGSLNQKLKKAKELHIKIIANLTV